MNKRKQQGKRNTFNISTISGSDESQSSDISTENLLEGGSAAEQVIKLQKKIEDMESKAE